MQRSELLRALLIGDFDALAHRARLAGIDTRQPGRLAVAAPCLPSHIAQRVSLATLDLGDHTALLGSVDRYLLEQSLPSMTAVAFHDAAPGIDHLRVAYQTAALAATGAVRLGQSGVLDYRETLLIAGLQGDTWARHRFVVDVLARLRTRVKSHEPVMVQTLIAAHQSGWNIAETARTLGLCQAGVCYRLRYPVMSDTGLDYAVPSERYQLSLAVEWGLLDGYLQLPTVKV